MLKILRPHGATIGNRYVAVLIGKVVCAGGGIPNTHPLDRAVDDQSTRLRSA
jgi:hypothetical protein